MIDATESLELAERISTPVLVEYLLSTGWSSRPSRVDGVSIFSKKISSSMVQFILPVKAGSSEESRRIADALRTVAQIEGRSVPELVSRVQGAKTNTKGAKRFSAFLSYAKTDLKSDEEIKDAALGLRKSLGLADETAFDIVELLENRMPKAMNHFRLEVLARRDTPEVYSTITPPRIFATASLYQQARDGDVDLRFVFAHEIAHLLLHTSVGSLREKSSKSSKGSAWTSLIETEAAKFALFFLVPDDVARQFNSVESLSVHCQIRREAAQLRMDYLLADDKQRLASVSQKIKGIFELTLREIGRRQSESG